MAAPMPLSTTPARVGDARDLVVVKERKSEGLVAWRQSVGIVCIT
jgi:hypothetical protein